MNSNGGDGTKASKYSIAKELVLQKIGAHEKTKDQTYYESKEKIATLEGFCADISNVLNLWLTKVRELSIVSVSLSKVWLRVYQGTDERMENVANAYCKEQENIKNKKITMLTDKIQTFTEAINNYRASVDVTKDAIESRRKLQLSFDHYNSKFASLKAQQEKNRTAGKLETLKQRERFERNNKKLSNAKKSFLKANQTVIKTLHHHWESRFGFLDDLFKQIISNETMFFEAFTKTLRSTKPVLQEALKKPLPKPTPAPSQADMDDLNDKVKYGKQTLFETDGKTEDSGSNVSITSESIPGAAEHLPDNCGTGDSKFGAIIGKAKNIFAKNDQPLEPGLNTDFGELTLEDGKLQSESELTTNSGKPKYTIDPSDPFAMFDSGTNKSPQNRQSRVLSTPVASVSNPFSSSGKGRSKSSPRDPWNSSKNTSYPIKNANSEDPFADVPQLPARSSGGPFDEGKAGSDPFSNTAPNPFAGEELEANSRRGEPSPDPFASLFN